MHICIEKGCGNTVGRANVRCRDCYDKLIASRKKVIVEKKLDSNIPNLIVESLKSEIKKVKPYNAIPNAITRSGDTCVIQLSDLHAGKVTKDPDGNILYNEEVFKHRINVLCGQILKILDKNIRQSTPITDVVILSTGDQANGEDIYETQVYEQEMAPPRQVMIVVDAIIGLILALLKRGLPVSFFGVKGNHGRLAKDANPSANWDLMIYLVLEFWAKTILKNKNLTIKYAETDHMIVNIKTKKYMIRHIAPENSDTPSGRVKFNEWARKHKLDAIVYGHWHHFGITDVDGIRVFRGGSVSGEDSLSESMAKHSEPVQLIWGVNKDRAMTFLYAVDLRLGQTTD